MKNIFFALVIVFAAAVSCRNDDDLVQQIDQVVNLYIDSAGIDMLNSSVSGSYKTVTMNDVNGITDTAPVSVSIKSDEDTIRYIDYVSGARRIIIDSSDANTKIYESKIAIIFTKKLTDSTTSTFSDTLILNYVLKPEVFRLEKAWYNNNLVFTKVDGQSNIIKITK